MKILLLPRDGVRLYHELLASETSRDALRFYRPVETPSGIEIIAASLGSALTLVADIRWYVKRYMRAVLFEITPGVYCTHRLAYELFYDREISFPVSWDFRFVYRMKDGRVIREEQVLPGSDRPLSGSTESPEIEVWCTEDEYHGGSSVVAAEDTDEDFGEQGGEDVEV
jgi:hypothetical protein